MIWDLTDKEKEDLQYIMEHYFKNKVGMLDSISGREWQIKRWYQFFSLYHKLFGLHPKEINPQ